MAAGGAQKGVGGAAAGARAGGQVDPSRALTAAEAARLAGVPRAEIGREMDAGRLLFETGRRRGRDVRLVRVMDLGLLYPRAVGSGTEGTPSDTTSTASTVEPRTDATLSTQSEPSASRADRAPPEHSNAPPNAPPSAPAAEAPDGMRHAVEVRLASIQASNSALSERLRDAQDVREDLRGQCDDLRMRLSSIEKERQATTVGLLMAQKRILELEAGPRPAPLRAWRRTGTWAMALVCLAVLAMWRDAVHARETLEGEASEGALVLEKSLAAAAAAREDFGEQLARIEAHSRASQAEFETERGLAAELRTRLEARLDEERTNAKALTQRLDSELSRAAQRWDTVQGALEDSRTETARAEAALAGAREAAASEREQRQRAWLAERRQAEERMDELLAEVRETRTEMASLLAQPAAPAQGTRPIARRSFTARMLAAVRSWASSEQSVPD